MQGEEPDLVSRPLALNSKPRAILTSEKAVEIFSRSLTSTVSSSAERPHATSVAREYGVSEKTVRDIWTGRTWSNETRHLDPHRPPREAKPTGRPRGRQDSTPRKRKLEETGTLLTNGGFDSLSRGSYHARIHPAQEVRSTSRSDFSAYDKGTCAGVFDDSDCQPNPSWRISNSTYCSLSIGPLHLSALQTGVHSEGDHGPKGCQEAGDFDLGCVSSETDMRGSWDSDSTTGAAAGGEASEGPRMLSAVWKLDEKDYGATRAGGVAPHPVAGGFDRPEEWRRGEDAAYRIRVSDGTAPDCSPLVPKRWNPNVARAVGRPAREPGAPSAAHGPPGDRHEQLGLPYPTESKQWQGPSRIEAAAEVEEPDAQDQTLHPWTAATNDWRAGIWAGGGGGGGGRSGDGSDGGAGGGHRIAPGMTYRNRGGGRELGKWNVGDSDELAWNGPVGGQGWGGARMDPLRACDAATAGAGCCAGGAEPFADILGDIGQAADGGGSRAEYSRPPDSGPTAGGRSFAQPPAAASSSNRWPDTSSAAAAIGAGRVDAVGSLRPLELGCWGPAPPPQPPTSAKWASMAEEQEGQGWDAARGFWGRRQEQLSRQGCRQHSEQTQPHQQRHPHQIMMQQLQTQPHQQQRPRSHHQQYPLQHPYELQGQPQPQPQQHLHQLQHQQQLQQQPQQQYGHPRQHHLQLLQMQPQQQHQPYWAESEQQFKQHVNKRQQEEQEQEQEYQYQHRLQLNDSNSTSSIGLDVRSQNNQ